MISFEGMSMSYALLGKRMIVPTSRVGSSHELVFLNTISVVSCVEICSSWRQVLDLAYAKVFGKLGIRSSRTTRLYLHIDLD